MFRYLRCGLSQISEDEIDLLENYVLAAGIRGKKNGRQDLFIPPMRLRKKI